jgi:predicted PurR-regulated permease PerM
MALNGLFVLAVVYTLSVARTLLLPVAVGVLLYLLLRPAVDLLGRFRIRESLAAGLVTLALVAVVGMGAYALSYPAANWIARAPASLARAEERLAPLIRRVQRLTRTAEEMERIATVEGKGAAQEVTVKEASLGEQLFGGVQALMAGAVVVISLAYFLLASGDMFAQKLVQALPRLADRKRAMGIAREMQHHLSEYLLYTTAINVLWGVGVALLMWALRMPNPVLWGVLAGVANFVPYLGGLACLVVLTLVSLVTFDSLWRALLVPGVFLVLDTVHSNVITPLLMGRRFTLNTPVLFLGLLFWWYVWGVAGALLAVPLLSALKIVCERVPGLQGIAIFLGDESDPG